MKISKPCVFATLKMRSMFSMVLFSSRLSRTRGHASPVSLSTSFCGSMNTTAVSLRLICIVPPRVENLSRWAFSGFPAPSARHQINVRPRLEERISRGLDAFDARYGIENDLLLLCRIVRGDGSQTDLSECDQLTALRPADGRIIRD